MENFITLAVVILFLVYSELKDRRSSLNNKEEKIMLIREITTAIKAPTLIEYNDSLPEYDNKKEVKEIIKDDIVEIDQVEPDVLLRALK